MSSTEGSVSIIPITDVSTTDHPTGYWKRVWQRLLTDRVTLGALAVLLAIIAGAIFAPWLAPYDPYTGGVITRLKAVGTVGHLLGTDETGRDMLSRLLYGGRTSLVSGVAPVLFALLVGGTLGVTAGFNGGFINSAIMRITDIFFAFPSILLAVVIVGLLGAGLTNTILSLTIVFIPQIIRISESVTTQVRSLDFVEAARASGANGFSIVRFHILPNVLGPILVYSTSLISISIILAAGLSFLGLGVTPPTPEWGLMLNALRPAIYVDLMLAAMPGAMIFITSVCFNLIADGLRTAMDIRIRIRG
ncbi:ABC transporter permease [Mesorhizobium sp. M7A.F.Ca.US.006.01.1.1]|uniref:ABC transporter permease n=1 Tax=Mesorhizobium sp. M7A.F.Ca.US.006.01.1.1 TaxID=2496707 RepID=UPI000FCA5931|nr:ABC transporter permease [Mesorhizobium sp. M7A.F.Ca.US.006.01.1.1]RUZ71179.1 ABC transporter permease [Mesorhizobium sp. M7A.F.Ca.US.006.01.1.1]